MGIFKFLFLKSRAALTRLGSVAHGELCGSDRAGGLRSAVELLDFLWGWGQGGGRLSLSPRPDGEGWGRCHPAWAWLQLRAPWRGRPAGLWKGPVRERGPHPRSHLHCEELGLGGVSSPSLGGTLGVLPACPLYSSPPHRGTPPTASLRTLETQTVSQTFPWHLKSRTGLYSALLVCDV